MSATSPTPSKRSATRPRIVTVAFWTSVAGAILLVVGGLFAITRTFAEFRGVYPASVTDDAVHAALNLHRGAGVIFILVGLVLAFLSGRVRNGDARFRRANVALSVVVVVLFGVAIVFFKVVLELPAVLALVPIAVGATLYARPGAAVWFDSNRDVIDE